MSKVSTWTSNAKWWSQMKSMVMEMDMDHDDQVLHTWKKRKKRKTKMGSRQRYINRGHFWFGLKIP
jgi:hypothetical protein